MIILLLFAFIAGIVTILSPCVFPVLPFLLAAGAGGAKRRPIGIVAGFVVSFTFFTLTLTSLVKVSGISANGLRIFSIVILGFFGLSILVPKLLYYFELLTTKIVPQKSLVGSEGSGFKSGFLVGISLGLIWTPRVGPIMASVIALSASSAVNTFAIFIRFPNVGTAIPMFGIIWGGRNLIAKVSWLKTKGEVIQKSFGALTLVVAVALAFGFDRQFQTWFVSIFPQYGTGLTAVETNSSVQKSLGFLKKGKDSQLSIVSDQGHLPDLGPAPEFVGIDRWFNVSKPLTLAELKGKVILVDFWTYSCINCIRTLPYLRSWYETYKDKGLVIVGIHAPEFAFERNAANVQDAIKQFGITYSVGQDNEYKTWSAYQNQYWPAKYLIDAKGHLRWKHFGEGNYTETERHIRELLQENGQVLKADFRGAEQSNVSGVLTPETYLGTNRMENFASDEKAIAGKSDSFTHPLTIPLHSFAFEGLWRIAEESVVSENDSAIILHFRADQVYLVITPGHSGDRIKIFLDGQQIKPDNSGHDVRNSEIVLDQDRLYHLVDLKHHVGEHLIRLEFKNSGIKVYAFTFG